VKANLLGKGSAVIAELKAIGFDYELVANGKPKIGRPKKERANGTPIS
jgi:hypothetical protein